MGQERDNPKSKEDSGTIACIASLHPQIPGLTVSTSVCRITSLPVCLLGFQPGNRVQIESLLWML